MEGWDYIEYAQTAEVISLSWKPYGILEITINCETAVGHTVLIVQFWEHLVADDSVDFLNNLLSSP